MLLIVYCIRNNPADIVNKTVFHKFMLSWISLEDGETFVGSLHIICSIGAIKKMFKLAHMIHHHCKTTLGALIYEDYA